MYNNYILINGYSLLAIDPRENKKLGNRSWENVVWGNDDLDLMGRVPIGIYRALKDKPSKIIFGTGASCFYNGKAITRKQWVQKGKPEDIEWEADYIFNFLANNFERLTTFKILQEVINEFGGIDRSFNYIKKKSVTDTNSSNTKEEILNAFKLIKKSNELSTITIITSPSHQPRCISIANTMLPKYNHINVTVLSYGHQTDFAEDEMPIIFEPQSGGEIKQEYSPCRILKNYFKLSDNEKDKFLKTIKCFFRNTEL